MKLKVIYHPLYGMNNYVLIWGDWLSCDPLRGSNDSQSPHIWRWLTIMWPSQRVTWWSLVPHLVLTLLYLSQIYSYYIRGDGSPLISFETVDGSWSDWGLWTDCSVTCGEGQTSRSRQCSQPSPAEDGLDCPGEVIEVKGCQIQSCPTEPGQCLTVELSSRLSSKVSSFHEEIQNGRHGSISIFSWSQTLKNFRS